MWFSWKSLPSELIRGPSAAAAAFRKLVCWNHRQQPKPDAPGSDGWRPSPATLTLHWGAEGTLHFAAASRGNGLEAQSRSVEPC